MRRKMIAAAISMALAFSLAGCGASRPAESGSSAPVSAAGSEAVREPAVETKAQAAAETAAKPVIKIDTESGSEPASAAVSEPVTAAASEPAPVAASEPAAQSSPAPARQDGERFESVIMLEGMEEPVQYEHVRNEALGFEMDYDYEMFARRSEADREVFYSVYGDPENPEDYLEVRYDERDAETAAEAVAAELSETYDIYRDTVELDAAGSCFRIDASAEKGGQRMPEYLQAAYIIPAGSGSIVARSHCYITDSEGFGRRIRYMMHTLSVLGGKTVQ